MLILLRRGPGSTPTSVPSKQAQTLLVVKLWGMKQKRPHLELGFFNVQVDSCAMQALSIVSPHSSIPSLTILGRDTLTTPEQALRFEQLFMPRSVGYQLCHVARTWPLSATSAALDTASAIPQMFASRSQQG